MNRWYFKYALVLVLAFLISSLAQAQTQTHKTPGTAHVVNSFPYYHKLLNSSGGGTPAGMGGTCHTIGCCSTWVYRVDIPVAGSIRIDNLNFTALAGSAIAYRANKKSPSSYSDITYVSGQPGNFCGFRDSMQLGYGYSWPHANRTAAQNASRSVGWRTISHSRDTIGPGSYYILVWSKNNQVNFGSDTATFAFRFKPYCGGTTGRTCPPVLDITGNDNSIGNGSTTASANNHTLFDSVSLSSSKTYTYSIENSLDSFFTLTGTNPVSISGSSAFSIVNQPSDRSIDNDDSTTFQVKYTPTAIGSDTVVVSIANSLNTSFTFTLIGNALDLRPIVYAQKFEGTAADNWTYTPDPPKYATETDSVIGGSEDIWDIIREFTGDIDGAYDGRYFWGTQDLRNSNGGRSYAHHLNFKNVYLGDITDPKLKFNYYSDGFDASDSIFYEVFYDNVGQGKVFLDKNSDEWLTVRMDIPSNIDSFRFKWSAYNDGSADYSGFDGLEIRGTAGPSAPALAIDSMVVNSNISCFGNSTGAATAYASGGKRPFTFAWQGLSTTDSFITNLLAGTYYLTITDANSSTISDSVKISQPDSLSAVKGQAPTKSTNLSGVYGGWLDNATGIVESNPTTFVFAGQTSGTDHKGWLKFDVSSIPNNSVVDSIVLELYCNRGNGSGTKTIDINSANEIEGPYGSHNSTAFADFGNGLYTTVDVTGSGTYSGINLGANAASDLESQLSKGYFQIALDNNNDLDWKRFTSNLCNIQVYYKETKAISENICYGNMANAINTIDTASGGSGNYAYFWEVSHDMGTTYKAANGDNDSIYYVPVDVLTDTTYYRRRVVDLSCNDTVYNEAAKIFVADTMNATLVVDSNASTTTSTDGGVTVTATGGVAPYAYSWSNSATTASITNLSTGWYTVTITDAIGCIYIDSIEVKRRYSLDLAVTNHVSCNGLSDAIATANVEGGIAPITIEWSSRDTGTTVDSLSAGWYYVTAFDANNDTLTDSIQITEPALLVASSIVDSNVTCFGLSNGGATASATGGTMPYNYSWSNSATTASIQGVGAGKYTVTITDKNSCTDTSSVFVTTPDSISLNVTVDSNVTCNGLTDGGATANVTGGTMPYTYLWSNSATTASITGVGASTYTVTVTDKNGCRNNRSANVSEPAVLSATVSIDTNVACNGDLSGVISVSGTGGTMPYNYIWNNLATTTKLSKVAAGQYSVTITDANGCTDSDNGTITEPTLLSAGSITGDDVVCSGVAPNKITEVSAANGGTGSLSYQWQMSADNQNWSDISGATSSEYQPMGTAGNTWYRRAVTDVNACGPFYTNTVKITINGQPNVDFSATTACEDKQTIFTDKTTLSSGNIKTFEWTFGDKGTSTQQNPINVYSNSGTYTVSLKVVTDSGCVDSTSKTVSVNPVPSVNFSSTAECEGTATVLTNKSSISAGTLSYAWNLGDKNSSNATSPSYTYTNAGYYTVQLTATSSAGCVDSVMRTVQVKQVARPNFSATAVCEGNNTAFTNLSTNASTYSWDFGNSTGTSTKENPTYKYAASGTYTTILTATSADGCSDTTHKNVMVYGLPTAGLSATEVCLGKTTEFTNSSSGASSYQWVFGNGTSSNKFEPSLIYGKSGSYTVELTVTTANGCTDVTSSSITVNALPAVSFTTADICLSEDLKTTNTTTGASTYAWTFGDGSGSSASAPTHTYTANGKYKVLLVATSVDGCIDSANTNINAFAVPDVSFNAANVCDGNDVKFNNNSKIAAGTMTYVWNLGNGATTGNPAPSYQYASDGSYTVKLVATSNNGCKDSTNNNITVYAMPTVSFSAPSVCYGDTMFTNNLSSGAANYAWNFGDGNTSTASSPFNFYNKARNYDVKLIATTSNNCIDSLTRSVNIYAKPIANFSANDVCDETAVSFANNSYNAAIVSNNWTLGDGNSSQVINPNYTYASNGSYNVELITISDNGCSDTITKTVVIHPNPVVAFANTTECDYDSTEFTNFTTIASGTASYEWNFGTGDASLLESPNYMFPQAGAYVVSLTATSDKGCMRSTSSTVVVNPSPTAGISLANNCEGLMSSFASTSTLSKGKIANYAWDLGDGNTSTDMNPTNLYSFDGDYNISLIITTDKSCTDTALTSITIYNKPTADFSTPDVCFGKLNVFTDASVDAQDYTYDFGDKWGISILKEPEYTYEEPGTYNPTLYVTSAFGCRDTITNTVEVFELPVARFSVNNHCFGEDFTPTDNSLGTVTAWNWDYDNGDNDNGLDPIYTYKKDGNYNVRLIVTDNNTCVDSLRKMVTVWPLPKVWVRADTLVSKGYTVPLEARGGVAYKWNPVDNLDRPLTATPIATVIEDITYTVTVANEFGCTKDTFVNLRMEEDYTLEPSNIMTPDGNGMNDNWIVEKAQYYNDVEVIVFDRWGRIVYQNANYDNTWGGLSQTTGEALPDGAYYYIVKVPTDRETYKGSITIFR